MQNHKQLKKTFQLDFRSKNDKKFNKNVILIQKTFAKECEINKGTKVAGMPPAAAKKTSFRAAKPPPAQLGLKDPFDTLFSSHSKVSF